MKRGIRVGTYKYEKRNWRYPVCAQARNKGYLDLEADIFLVTSFQAVIQALSLGSSRLDEPDD